MYKIIFWSRIAIKELRYRTVILMIVFEAVGFYSVKPTKNITLEFVLISLVLALSYMSATAFNDVSDFEIDKLNIPKDNSRPLMIMDVTKHQLIIFGYAALMAATVIAMIISPLYILFAMSGIILSICYSLKPLRISYRGILAVLWLPLSYVVLSFTGGALVNGGLNSYSSKILLALYVSFIGRIILKDFRDVKGDKKFGKKTFLVRHGPKNTCFVAGIAWLVGDIILSFTLWAQFKFLIILIQPMVLLIFFGLYFLSREKVLVRQLTIIQFIGIIGNMMLIGLLTALCLSAYQYSTLKENVLIASVVIVYLVIAYKLVIDNKFILKDLLVVN